MTSPERITPGSFTVYEATQEPPWPSLASPYTLTPFGRGTFDHALPFQCSSTYVSCPAPEGGPISTVAQTLAGPAAAMRPGSVCSPVSTLIRGSAAFRQAPLLQCKTSTRVGCAATAPVTQSPAAALPLAWDGITGMATRDQHFPL